MQKFISQKQLYSSIKQVSDDVQSGTVFIVFKHSKPAYKIVPLDEENLQAETKKDDNVEQFIFYPKTKKKYSDEQIKKILAENTLNAGEKNTPKKISIDLFLTVKRKKKISQRRIKNIFIEQCS
jgi:antitoxin (DNA-binding transcriptional repressor) of toxin-antitoxin stability system